MSTSTLQAGAERSSEGGGSDIPLVYDAHSAGHRGRGVALLSKVVGGMPLTSPPSTSFSKLVGHRGVLLWQTADYELLWLVFVTACRIIRGRRTVALCYRNDESQSLFYARSLVRRVIVSLLRHCPSTEIIQVFPPTLGSAHRQRWIYDPEWWDLLEMPVEEHGVALLDGGTKSVLFIGNVDPLKGLDFFVDAAETTKRSGSRLKFIVVGASSGLTTSQRERLEAAGAVIVDDVPSDGEFIDYIRRATFLWCCYHPAYDQSSGVFGRALQLGAPAIVRRGSLLEQCARRFGNGIAVEYGDTASLMEALDRGLPDRVASEEIEEMRDFTVAELKRACLKLPG